MASIIKYNLQVEVKVKMEIPEEKLKPCVPLSTEGMKNNAKPINNVGQPSKTSSNAEVIIE